MEQVERRAQLIEAATPVFAKKGLHGVSVRELAAGCGCNVSMISYYFGGKDGLYEAVLREVFSGMLQMVEVAKSTLSAADKFKEYVYQCGICFHTADGEEFIPRTASADRCIPECPRCLNNDAESFSETKKQAARAAKGP
jgi:AcrR family transcriptional regulator